jgi:hypothetical protein
MCRSSSKANDCPPCRVWTGRAFFLEGGIDGSAGLVGLRVDTPQRQPDGGIFDRAGQPE